MNAGKRNDSISTAAHVKRSLSAHTTLCFGLLDVSIIIIITLFGYLQQRFICGFRISDMYL